MLIPVIPIVYWAKSSGLDMQCRHRLSKTVQVTKVSLFMAAGAVREKPGVVS